MCANSVSHNMSDYLERLAKAKIILPPDNFFVADETDDDYSVP